MAAPALPPKRYTPEDLLTIPDGDHYELVDGELVEKDMGTEASWIAGQVYNRLENFNKEAGLGWVVPAEASYQCFPVDRTRVRRPDASFIPYGRLPGERIPKGHVQVAPDLVVEVVSPNDLFSEVLVKVEEYLGAGVRLVWVVDPETRSITILRADESVARLHDQDELDGEDVLPGFRCRVGDLFPPEPGPEAERDVLEPTTRKL
jgi:Uma2 family endonuclease